MSYVSWFGSVRSGSDRFGSDQLGQTGSVRSGSIRTKSFQTGSVRTGSVRTKSFQTGSTRTGSVRTDSLLYALLSVNLLIQEIYLAYQIIPSTDRIIIACTVTVQLPMCVLHGMCHGRAPNGNDQLPKVELHNY